MRAVLIAACLNPGLILLPHPGIFTSPQAQLLSTCICWPTRSRSLILGMQIYRAHAKSHMSALQPLEKITGTLVFVQVVVVYTIQVRGKVPTLGYSAEHLLTCAAVCKDWCAVARQHTVWKPLLPLSIPSQDAWHDFQLVQRVVYVHLAG